MKPLLAAISINHSTHQQIHGEAVRLGLEKHGIQTVYTQGDSPVTDADFHVTWSIKRPAIFRWKRSVQRQVLVMERGHVGDRMTYCSFGWDGQGRRGRYATATDGGARWREWWGHLEQPWRNDGAYALVIGQVPGDSALYGLDEGFEKWTQRQIDALTKMGWAVRFRPHPLAARTGHHFLLTGATLSTVPTLAEDLAEAALCITYNSTSGVEAVLSGVPTITLDAGAMAWDVAGHTLTDSLTPDRTRWMHDLAFTQWSLKEIADGTAWEQVAPLREGLACAIP